MKPGLSKSGFPMFTIRNLMVSICSLAVNTCDKPMSTQGDGTWNPSPANAKSRMVEENSFDHVRPVN